MPARPLLLALALLLPATSAPAKVVNPGAIRSGTPGFGYSSLSGTIGTGTGYGQAGYVFVPTLGFRPAFTGGGRDLFFFPPEGRSGEPRPECRAEVTVRAPGLTDLWVGRRWARAWGRERSFLTPELPEGTDASVRVRAAWVEGGVARDQTRRVRVRPGQKVTVDFSLPEPR